MRATQKTRLCLLDGFGQDYTGKLSCFLAGISTCLFFSIAKARAIRRHESEMAARLRFYGTEDIGGPATLIFVIPARFSSWNRRRGGP